MADKVVVYSYMVGDLFHYGHLNHLRIAKELGDYLIVGVLTDEAAMRWKRKPIIPYPERFKIINQIKYVDDVIMQEDVNPVKNLKELSIDILVHSHYLDESPSHWQKGKKYMESIGKKAICLDYYPYQSTTKIIGEIQKRC